MSSVFVCGIGTDVGKTIACAVLAQAYHADYWKPLQCGNLEKTDADTVRELTHNSLKIFPERYCFHKPSSPHLASKEEGITVRISDFSMPVTSNNLIIEGAGGLLVPLNAHGDTMLNLIQYLKTPVIIVSRNYLGSINHTMLTLEVLKNNGIVISGIIFNGEENLSTEEYILSQSGICLLGKIPQMDTVNRGNILLLSKQFSQKKIFESL